MAKIKVLIFGGDGLVGSTFKSDNSDQYGIISPNTDQVNVLDKVKLLECFKENNPEVVVNFAAFTNVEEAEKEKGNKDGTAYQINSIGAKNVAEVCRQFNTQLIHISTEYVFDGQKSDSPYREDDSPNPINWYGQTKYFGEQAILESGCKLTLVRISMPFGSCFKLKKDIARTFLERLQTGQEIRAITDAKITPTPTSDIAQALGVIIQKKALGLYHISSTTAVSPFEFVKEIAREFNLDTSKVFPISFEEYNKQKKAKLLRYSWLNPSKFSRDFREEVLHGVVDGITKFKKELTL